MKEYKDLQTLLDAIRPVDEAAMKQAAGRQALLAKPPGSLGQLETISIRLSGITGKILPTVDKRRIIVMCADNGVAAEGVSSAPQSVTAAQAVNMTRYKTGMSSMAHFFGDEIEVVDVGIVCPYDCDKILNRRIAPGTRNLLHEPAMTRDQLLQAIMTGAERAAAAKADGIEVIGVGEMGIGNTTTSSAILSVLTGLDVETVTGRGGGLTDEAFLHKKEVLEQAIALHHPDPSDTLSVMEKLGGFDIAAMCGAFLGAAAERLPVVIDGFISVVAALCAARLAPLSTGYMFASHASAEPGYAAAVKELGLQPWLALDMRLGEGSGCPIAFQVIRAACAAMDGMARFGAESEIDDSYLAAIRDRGGFGE